MNKVPKSASDRAMLHMVHQVGMDVRNAFYRLTFGPDYVSFCRGELIHTKPKAVFGLD